MGQLKAKKRHRQEETSTLSCSINPHIGFYFDQDGEEMPKFETEKTAQIQSWPVKIAQFDLLVPILISHHVCQIVLFTGKFRVDQAFKRRFYQP